MLPSVNVNFTPTRGFCMKKVNRKHIKFLLIFIISITIIIGILLFHNPYIRYFFKTDVNNTLLESLDLDNVDNLMIVAHPDDEALWGGHSLLQKDYFVVCITNGYNETRSKEFYEVLEKSGDKGIILDYPDKIHNERCDWEFCKTDIIKDLETIISYKEWKTIVTHNEKGEYNHIHHIMTHSFVVDTCDKLSSSATQFYFGNYFSASSLMELTEEELPNALTTKEYIEKFNLLSTYKSQAKTLLKLGHMIQFEEFIAR
jgi:LmbE family N-acetylglucosaminyl deacetylase